jgi:hypothetical protein
MQAEEHNLPITYSFNVRPNLGIKLFASIKRRCALYLQGREQVVQPGYGFQQDKL